MWDDVPNPRGECSQGSDGAGMCSEMANRPNPFVLHGALIGGPKSPTDAGDPDRMPYQEVGWNDWRTDWIGNEQALDYNAGYTFALAAVTELPASCLLYTSPSPRD